MMNKQVGVTVAVWELVIMAAIVIAAICVCAACHANIIANPSFELLGSGSAWFDTVNWAHERDDPWNWRPTDGGGSMPDGRIGMMYDPVNTPNPNPCWFWTKAEIPAGKYSLSFKAKWNKWKASAFAIRVQMDGYQQEFALPGDALWHTYQAVVETNRAAPLRIGAVWEAGAGANDTAMVDELRLEPQAVVATTAFGATSDAAYNPSYVGTVLGIVGVVRGVGGNQYSHYLDVATVGSPNPKGIRVYYKHPLFSRGTAVLVDVLIDKPGRGQLKGIRLVEPMKVP
jgi:hypothetical protein